jgi:hypothetical protein
MNEELIPPDFLIRPDYFEFYFVERENYSTVRQMALDGRLGSIQNRFTAWRVFLGILPETFSIQKWADRTLDLQKMHEDLLNSHRVLYK